LTRILFLGIAERGQLLVAVERVVVEVDLGVERNHVALLRDHQRIDLHDAGIARLVRLVRSGGEADEAVHRVAGEAEPERQIARLVSSEADDRIDRRAQDLLRVLRGDLLDLHPTLAGRHRHVAADGAVEGDAEIELAGDVASFLDVDLPHLLALRAGLVGDELHAHHLLEDLARLFRAPRQLHSAALAAAARVNLRFDHDDALLAHQLARGGDGFVLRLDQLAARDRDAVSAQDLLGLVLVDLHGGRLSTPHRQGAQARVGARTSSVSSGSRFYAAQLRRVPTRLSNCGASTGRLRWYPCAYAQCILRKTSSCCSVSTPSATTSMSRLLARARMVLTISTASSLAPMRWMKLRSILRVSMGNWCR